MAEFGNIVDGGMVERAVQATLKTWLPAYLAHVERLNDRAPGNLPAPRDWRIVNEVDDADRLGPKQFPAVWLVSPGLEGEPYQAEDTFSATWLVTIAVIVSANKHESTIALARLYTAAIRAALTQKPPAEPLVATCRWLDEAYDRGPAELENTIAWGTLTFRVTVDDVLSPYGGPETPPDDPTEDPIGDPTVLEVDLDVQGVEITEQLP